MLFPAKSVDPSGRRSASSAKTRPSNASGSVATCSAIAARLNLPIAGQVCAHSPKAAPRRRATTAWASASQVRHGSA